MRGRALAGWRGVAALLLLAGCRLGPDYAAPHPELPAAWRAAADSAATTAIATDWWKGFGSPDLDALMADAASNSFDVRAAIARVGQADASLRAAGAALLPQIDGTAKQSWTRTSFANASGGTPGLAAKAARQTIEYRTYSLGPSVSYELDFWGANRAAQEAAAASALFSRYDRETVTLTTLGSTATTWFTALAYQDRLTVAEHNLHDSEDILKAIKARLEVGTASELDVAQEEAEVAGFRAAIPNFRNLRDQEVAALSVLVGRLPENVPTPPGTLTTLNLPPVAPGLPSTLLARRPDVASAEAQLISQNANIRAARAAFFPTISLTGSAGWQSNALQTLLQPQSQLFNAAASVTQTIFDNGKLGAQYQQARARYDELLADYHKAVVQAFTDVETALTAWRETTEQERLEQEAVRTAQRAADIARAQVEAGTLDIVSALQTQSTLYTDQDTLAQVRLSRFLALVDLYKALGGGWTARDVAPPETPIFNGVL
jgi:NodT family efflux transporter outer membrane factor (OMF) lipoprotein